MRLWKIKREIKRLAEQLLAIPAALYEPYLQKRHDERRDSELKLTWCSGSFGNKIAIFLIFQPRGVPQSIHMTCRHLTDSGFSTMIVSNAPLSDVDRATLAGQSCLVVERPNFGYDFGGYRDAVWLLQNQGLDPDEVLFLNDSIWFPVVSNSSLLSDMSASQHVYVGVQQFGNVTAESGKRGFFASYCFLVKRQAWQSRVFQEFWSGYQCSSNKEITLRRGERGFSRRMLEQFPESRALFSVERFNDVVDSLSAADLWEVVQELVTTSDTLETERANMLDAGFAKATVPGMKRLINASVVTKNYLGVAPILSIDVLGLPIIKKNNEMLYVRSRQRVLEAYDEGKLEGLDPDVLGEIRQSCL